MVFTHSFRERPLLFTALVAVGVLILSLAAQAQEYPDEEWGNEGTAQVAGAQALHRAPPKVVASTMGVADYRPPVDPPGGFPAGQAPAPATIPVQKAAAAPAAVAAGHSGVANETYYVVQPGDNAPRIAQKVLGNANRWQELMAYNKIPDPNLLQVGLRLRIPAAAGGQPAAMAQANAASGQVSRPATTGQMAVAPKGQAPDAVRVAAAGNRPMAPPTSTQIRPPVTSPVPATKAKTANQEYEAVEPEETSGNDKHVEADASYYGQTGGTYVIQRGDTLGKIAKKLLGSTQRWREIARANPQMNPNKLIVGMTINVPGASVEPQMGQPPNNMVAAGNPGAMAPGMMGGASFDASGMAAPSYEPPPLVAPPPAYNPSAGAPHAYNAPQRANPPQGQAYGAPPAFAAPITPPPPPPVTVPQAIEPPPPPYMSAPTVPAPLGAVPAPVTTSLYREERYRIPDELKPTDYSPYFGNFNGVHGLFETESALIPYMKTWHFGLHFRYDKYKYLNGDEKKVDGRQWIAPVNLLYTGKKMFASVVVPFQSWEVTSAVTSAPTVTLSGAHDPEVKAGYQIWKNYEGNHAVTLHVGGRFPGDNYHQPLADLSGKTRTGIRIGPANATRGGWVEFGGAYSGRLSDRWTSHLNLALANDSEDSIARYMYRGMLDYRVNQHYSLVMELNGNTWEMDNGPDGANIDLTLGMALFNEGWQGVLGFPVSLQSKFGYGHDYGVTFGLNTRWD